MFKRIESILKNALEVSNSLDPHGVGFQRLYDENQIRALWDIHNVIEGFTRGIPFAGSAGIEVKDNWCVDCKHAKMHGCRQEPVAAPIDGGHYFRSHGRPGQDDRDRECCKRCAKWEGRETS